MAIKKIKSQNGIVAYLISEENYQTFISLDQDAEEVTIDQVREDEIETQTIHLSFDDLLETLMKISEDMVDAGSKASNENN